MQNNFRKFQELVFCDLWFPDSGFRFPVSWFLGLPGNKHDKRFGNLLNVNFVRKKIDYPREHYTTFPLVMRKCCYLLGKLRKYN